MADKCSIKRSVLGAMCKLGSNVKIINSVLMDGVQVQDGCHLQNSIVCHNAHLQVLHSCPPKTDGFCTNGEFLLYSRLYAPCV